MGRSSKAAMPQQEKASDISPDQRRALADETLRSLLQPNLSVEEFLDDWWEQKPIILHRESAEGFNHIFSMEDVGDAAVNAFEENVLFFKDCQLNRDFNNIHLAWLHDVSLIINHLDKAWPNVLDFCHRLSPIFGHVYANMYLTPAGSQTAPPHTDDRDVIIVQVYGHKHWRVWDAPNGLCYKEEQLGKGQPPLRAEELGEPTISDTLEQGDILYMPRGFLHEANTSDTTSLHITFAIPTADFAWGHMMSEMVESLARSIPSLRRSVPLGFLHPVQGSRAEGTASAVSSEQAEQEWKVMMQNVVEKLDFAAVCKHFEGKMHCHNQKQLSAAEDVKDNLDAERMKKGLRLSSRLRKTEGIKVKKVGDALVFAQANGAQATVSNPSKTLIDSLKALGQISVDKKGMFPVGDLAPGADPFTKIAVAEIFVQMRLVELAKQAPIKLAKLMPPYPPSYDAEAFDMARYAGDSGVSTHARY